MASQDNGNPSLSGARLSPGDAAFERLTRREALKVKETPDSTAEPAAAATGEGTSAPDGDAATLSSTVASDALLPAEPPLAPAIVAPMVAASAERDDPLADPDATKPDTNAAAAMAPVATPGAKAAIPASRADEAGARIIAVAAALGIEDLSEPTAKAPPVAIAPSKEVVASPSAPKAPALAVPVTGATAERLEAALLDQLRTLEETLQTPPRMPRAEPLRPSRVEPESPDFIGPPRRSAFAPDPVRQRTYVDLRAPVPAPESVAAEEPPWRKYLAAPRPPAAHRAAPPAPTRPAVRLSGAAVAPVLDHKAEAGERGRGIRAMSAAAVLGLGVGLGIVMLMRPFAGAVVSSTPLPVDAAAPVVASAAASAAITVDAVAEAAPPASASPDDPMDQALATLLAEPTAARHAPGQPAVISEPGIVPAPAVNAAAQQPATAVSAEPPVVIRPPAGTARVARVPDFDAAESGPLAYVPAVPSYDPVRRSLLEAEAADEPADEPAPVATARATADDPPAATAPVRRGRATINTFVNMRSKPDNAAPVVAILAQGLSVRVLGCDYWCEVEAGGKRGYVFKNFLAR